MCVTDAEDLLLEWKTTHRLSDLAGSVFGSRRDRRRRMSQIFAPGCRRQ